MTHKAANSMCSRTLLSLRTLVIVNVLLVHYVHVPVLYCRVEPESSGREEEDSPIIVLFTGISQSVVKNLKQVRKHSISHRTVVMGVACMVTQTTGEGEASMLQSPQLWREKLGW